VSPSPDGPSLAALNALIQHAPAYLAKDLILAWAPEIIAALRATLPPPIPLSPAAQILLTRFTGPVSWVPLDTEACSR